MAASPTPSERPPGSGLGPSVARALVKLSPRGERVPVRLRRAVRPLTARLLFLGVRPQDVLIASYPRSGSTWLRFLLTEILTRRPVEWPDVNRTIPDAGGQSHAPALLAGRGRLIKTHDRHIGPCRRAVYVVRDVRDVILSEYRWELRDGVQRTLDEQIELTLANRIPTTLFGSWRDHVGYWMGTDAARRGDLLLVRFEALKRDPHGTLREVLAFLGAQATDDEIDGAIEDNSVERMRAREEHAVNAGISAGDPRYPWIGQGAAGGWRSKLSREQIERLEAATGKALARLGYPIGGRPDAD